MVHPFLVALAPSRVVALIGASPRMHAPRCWLGRWAVDGPIVGLTRARRTHARLDRAAYECDAEATRACRLPSSPRVSRPTDECPGAISFGMQQTEGMRIAMLLLVLPLVVACSAVEDVKPDAPDVTAEKASVTKISPAGIDLLLELGAYNPNSISLEAQSVTAKVLLDGTYDMGTVEIPQEVELPSKQQIRVDVPVTVDWKDVTVVASLIALKRNVPYDIDGSVKIGRDLFKVSVDFHVSDVMTEEQLRGALGVPDGGVR